MADSKKGGLSPQMIGYILIALCVIMIAIPFVTQEETVAGEGVSVTKKKFSFLKK